MPNEQIQGVSVSASDMIMGDSGSGKSALLGTLAEYVWETYGKITLLYSADAGGWPSNVQSLVDLGIMRVWKLKSRDPEDKLGLAFETVVLACRGYWPKVFRDARSGLVDPRVELLPPMTQRFKLFCPNGHLVMAGSKPGELRGVWSCAPDGDRSKCGLSVSLDSGGRVDVESFRTPGFEDVGAVCYDGITSIGYWGLQDLGDRGARVEDGAKDQTSALRSGLVIESGELLFGSNTMTHYGQVQTMVERALTLTGSIPFLVTRPVWTALKKRGTDEGKVVVYGPDIPGSAKTALLPRLVGNLLGTECVYVREGREYRLYLSRYELPGDPTPTLCKTRVSPGYLKHYLTDGPVNEANQLVRGGEHFTDFSLKTFYRLEAKAIEEERLAKAAKYKNTPGIFTGSIGAGKSEEVLSGKSVVLNVPVGMTKAAPGAPVGPPAGAPKGPGPGAPPPAPVAVAAAAPAVTAPPPPVKAPLGAPKGPGPGPQPVPPLAAQAPKPPVAPAAPAGPGLVPPAGSRSTKKPKPPAGPTVRPE